MCTCSLLLETSNTQCLDLQYRKLLSICRRQCVRYSLARFVVCIVHCVRGRSFVVLESCCVIRYTTPTRRICTVIDQSHGFMDTGNSNTPFIYNYMYYMYSRTSIIQPSIIRNLDYLAWQFSCYQIRKWACPSNAHARCSCYHGDMPAYLLRMRRQPCGTAVYQ